MKQTRHTTLRTITPSLTDYSHHHKHPHFHRHPTDTPLLLPNRRSTLQNLSTPPFHSQTFVIPQQIWVTSQYHLIPLSQMSSEQTQSPYELSQAPPQFTPTATPSPLTDIDTSNKIAVIGGGISGVSTAYYLQQQGLDVVLIETFSDVAQGATKVSIPLLKRYQEPIVEYDLYDKIKSKFCPVRMFSRAQQLANTYTHAAFHDSYGWDIAKLVFDQPQVINNTSKLSVLTQSNYNETLDLIRSEQLSFNLTPGHLYVADSRTKNGSAMLAFRQFKTLYKDCDMFRLKKDESSWLFPALQQDKIDLYGGNYTPSTLIFHPTDFTCQLRDKIIQHNDEKKQNTINPLTKRPYGNVDFLFNHKATGFTLNPDTQQITEVHIASQQYIPISEDAMKEFEEEQRSLVAQREALERFHEDANKPAILPGPNAGQLPPATMHQVTTTETAVPIKQVILCNGYQAYQITEKIDPEGPLLQIIPVRSISFDVYDKTRARFERTVPTLFPTHPISYYPEDPEFTRVQAKWEMDLREAGLDPNDVYKSGTKHPLLAPPKVDPLSVEEIARDYTSQHPVPYSGLAAVEFATSGLTLVADQHNPRHFYGFLGKDMAEIGDQVADKHLDNVLGVLESIRKIPEGALMEIDPDKDKRQRRNASHKSKGSRHLSMQPSSMALHTVGRDGLPVIGPAPKVHNLFFNTGHGVSPHNTAIIGGKMVAQYISSTPLNHKYRRLAEENDILRKQGKAISLPTLNMEDIADVDTALGIRSIKHFINNANIGAHKYNNKYTKDFTDHKNFQNYVTLADYLPTRWPQHQFTPSWFDNAQLTREQQRKIKEEQTAKQFEKRQRVLEARHAANEKQTVSQ